MNRVVGGQRYEPIKEFVKFDGVLWQVLQKGTNKFSVAGAGVYCTSCFQQLPTNLKCEGCNKQHKMSLTLEEAAPKAAESYNAQLRRKEYKIVVPQIGEKIAESDLRLPDNRFMNVKLEDKKGVEQVVITVGDSDQSRKAQIFVDLAKNEIRHDQANDSPKEFITSIGLDAGEQRAKKDFSSMPSAVPLSHPYAYVNGSSYSNWADGSSISLNIMSDEPEEYFLEQIELEGFSAMPNRSLAPKSITSGVVINGASIPFSSDKPRLKMILSRPGERFLVEQEIKTSSRADGKFNLEQWIEKPNLIQQID
jgi:hypothetical protein